jgi:hypothetical protein
VDEQARDVLPQPPLAAKSVVEIGGEVAPAANAVDPPILT